MAMDDNLHLDWEKAFPGSISLPKALYKVDRQLIGLSFDHTIQKCSFPLSQR